MCVVILWDTVEENINKPPFLFDTSYWYYIHFLMKNDFIHQLSYFLIHHHYLLMD